MDRSGGYFGPKVWACKKGPCVYKEALTRAVRKLFTAPLNCGAEAKASNKAILELVRPEALMRQLSAQPKGPGGYQITFSTRTFFPAELHACWG